MNAEQERLIAEKLLSASGTNGGNHVVMLNGRMVNANSSGDTETNTEDGEIDGRTSSSASAAGEVTVGY